MFLLLRTFDSFTTLFSKKFTGVNPKNLHKRHINKTLLPRHTFTNLKDTHRENAQCKKTQALLKSISMGIWLIGTLNQRFTRVSYIQIKF